MSEEKHDSEEKEVALLEALLKGPALPIELAVRTYSFPEEIASPLEALEKKGEVARQPLSKGEMIVLTQVGYERVSRERINPAETTGATLVTGRHQ